MNRMKRFALSLFVALTLMTTITVSAAGHAEPRQFNIVQMVQGEAVQRQYWLYEPASLKPQPALVVALHGYSSSAERIMAYSALNKVADEKGFLVAYPQGSTDSQDNSFFNVGYAFHQDSGIDDVAFVEAIVGTIQSSHGVDPRQIFATGMSNGGDMSYLLACRSSGLFRAVAPIAGSMMLSTMKECQADTTTPILAISGTDDPVTLFNGDQENAGGWGLYAGQEATVDFWANRFVLQKLESRSLINSHRPWLYGDSSIVFERYGAAASDMEFWFYRVDGGGHDWPGALVDSWWHPSRLVALYGMGFGKNYDINTSEEVWRFFSHWIETDSST